MIRQNWQMYPKAVPLKLVDEITTVAGKTMQASTFNDSGEDVRKSRVAWLKDRRILNLLYDYVDMANKNIFNVHIYKVADVQYTEYFASEGGHYDWHHDIDWNRNDGFDRKLSITIQLSSPEEYEGGDFLFNECQSPSQAKEKGTVLVFPSYLQHKVTPITKGVRRSLVAWFEGPKWK